MLQNLEIEVGETVNFTVTGNEGSDLTQKSEIFINGVKTFMKHSYSNRKR